MADKEQPKNTPGGEPEPEKAPMSIIAEPVASLMVAGVVQPPSRPGLLGSLDHYELLNVLGSGGMGLVFLARDTENGRQVAIKMVRSEYRAEPRIVQRFLLEARHLQKLKAPGIVPVLEVCERGEGSYIVMPYYKRGSLPRRMQEGKPEDTATALQVAAALADALAFAHRKGITHRDIKPANVLLGDDGAICLADFGLARTVFNDSILDPDRDQCEGTPAYMSPAVAAGEAEDTRCDIYSLGAVLYEMLTGQPPYQGPSTRAVRDQIIAGPPKPIRDINPKADPHLTQVAEWAMARAHRDRYASMADVAADLRRATEGKPPIGPHAFARKGSWPLVSDEKTAILLLAFGLAAMLALALVLWPNREKADAKKLVRSPASSGIEATNSPWAVNAFEFKQVLHWEQAVVVNSGEVPGKEILVVLNNRLVAVSTNGYVRKSWPGAAPYEATLENFLLTKGQEGLDYGLLVAWSRGTSNGIVELNANLFEGKHFQLLGAERHSNDIGAAGALLPRRLLASEESRDGRKKLIAVIQTSFGKKPRGLCCFDYETGQPKWQQLVGPMLGNLECLDLDGDGYKDFICGSISSENGNVAADGTDDNHSYVFAWSNSGEPLWCMPMSGTNSGAEVFTADLNGDGKQEIVAWVHRGACHQGSHELESSKIVHLDHRGQVAGSYEPGPCMQSCLIADLNRDGRAEVICSDCQGDVHILGPDFKPIKQRTVFGGGARRPGRFDRPVVSLVAAGHFQQSDRINLLVHCWMIHQDSDSNPGDPHKKPDPIWYEHQEIQLLDTDLNTVARYPLFKRPFSGKTGTVKAADIDGDGLDEILSLGDQVEILKYIR
jgi:serine/threonine protein kinase